MTGQHAPLSPVTEFTDQLRTLAARVAELERLQGTAGTWQTITLASANWTQNQAAEWRYNAGNVELRGYLTRTTSAFPANSNLFALGSGSNPPVPGRQAVRSGYAQVAALTPDATTLGWVVDTSGSVFRSATATHPLAVGDSVSLDGVSWPI